MSQNSTHVFSVYTSGEPYHIVSIPFLSSDNSTRIVNAIKTQYVGTGNETKRENLLREYINNVTQYTQSYYYLQPSVTNQIVIFSTNKELSETKVLNTNLTPGIPLPFQLIPNTTIPMTIPGQEISLSDDVNYLKVDTVSSELRLHSYGGNLSNVTNINCDITNQLIGIKKTSSSSDPVFANFKINIHNETLVVKLVCKLRFIPITLYRQEGTLANNAKHGILFGKNILIANKVKNETKT